MAKIELKQPIVEEIASTVKDAATVVIVSYSGITVAQDTAAQTAPRSWCHVQGIQEHSDDSRV